MSVNKKNSDGSYNQYASKPYVTKDNIGLSRVENKNSEDIRGEITSKNVTDALGYTPVNPNPQFIYDTEVKMTKVVPDGVNKGIVSMIGGKTVKGKNLFDITNVKTLINCKVENNVITNTKADTRSTVYIRVIAGSTILISDKVLKATGHYTFTFTSTLESSELTIKNSGTQTDTGITVNMETPLVKDRIYTVSFDAISVNPTIVGGLVLSNIQVEEGSTATEYEPYHKELWNAPVRKVVLEGKNLFDPKAFCDDEENKKYYTYSNGGIKINSVDTRDYNQFSFSIKVPAGNYSFTGVGSEIRIYDKTSAKQISSEKFTLAVDSEISFKFLGAGSTVYPMLERNSNASPYTPYTKTTLSLESIVDNLPDYGISVDDEYNYIDFENMVYHHKVDSIDMGSLAWSYNTTYKRFQSGNVQNIKLVNVNEISPLLCGKYETTTATHGYNGDVDKSISGIDTIEAVRVTDSMYTDASLFKSAMSGVMLNYELAQEELIDISDILMPFKCESGGTITFENEHNLDVPNTVIYEKEMK